MRGVLVAEEDNIKNYYIDNVFLIQFGKMVLI